jgi:hypothetical protein
VIEEYTHAMYMMVIVSDIDIEQQAIVMSINASK